VGEAGSYRSNFRGIRRRAAGMGGAQHDVMVRNLLTVLVLATAAACGSNASEDDDASADAISGGACGTQIEDLSGEGRSAADIAKNNDAVAKLLLNPTANGCPLTFKAVIDKLKAAGCGKDGMNADIVSERSQLIGKPEGGRGVLVPNCKGLTAAELLLAPPVTLHTSGPLPAAVEIIAQDTRSGVFNFYAAENGKWRFFGDSRSMLKGAGKGDERRCASCHTSGGLVMKELDSPWMNWPGQTGTTGADEVRENLGKNLDVPISRFSQGFREFKLQTTVEQANETWNKKRIEHIQQQGTVAELLKPLFCTQEVNFKNSGQRGGDVDVGASFEVEAVLGPDAYAKAIKASGQIMLDGKQQPVMRLKRGEGSSTFLDTKGKPLEGPAPDNEPFHVMEDGRIVDANEKVVTGREVAKEVAVDTVVPGFGVTVAAIDASYIGALVERKLVSSTLERAIRRVDMTRPLFSDARCGLLAALPQVDLKSAQGLAQRIDAALLKALEAKSPRTAAESELLANVKESDAAGAARFDKFASACAARQKSDAGAFALDALRVLSQQRNRVRKMPIAEHNELMPFDKLNVSDSARLDPKTCLFK
jgi:hypothetical protein